MHVCSGSLCVYVCLLAMGTSVSVLKAPHVPDPPPTLNTPHHHHHHHAQDPWFKHMCPDISKLSHTTPRSAQGPEEIRAIVQQAKQIADSYRQHMTDDFDLQDYHYSDDERGMDDAG